MRTKLTIGGMALALAALAVFSACGGGDGDKNGGDVKDGPPELSGETIVTDDGLQYIEIQPGTGAAPQAGQTVRVHYTGWLIDGTKFDSSVDRAQPLEFVLGVGQVIPGWDEGVLSMKVGGKRRLIIPPELAYGTAGRPPTIPPSAHLVFDVELLAVVPPTPTAAATP